MNNILEELKTKDIRTYEHSMRVGLLTRCLALCLGKSESEAKEIQSAAEMHDIGKLQIADEVLKSTSPLTQNQWEEIQMHPVYGAAIAKNRFNQMTCDAIRYHHVDYRGGGYPICKETKSAIPEVARIVAICDVFDAITARRCYKSAMSIAQAKEIMDNNLIEGKFDPMMYKIFWVKCIPTIYGKAAAL